MAAVNYRLVEALALLPILYLPCDQDTVVLCTGPLATTLASNVLRWRDVKLVYLLSPPSQPLTDPRQTGPRQDKRVLVGMPPYGTCSAVLTSPGEDVTPYLNFIAKSGVLCASVLTLKPDDIRSMLAALRAAFPRGVVPWREFLPAEIYGALASPQGPPKRIREPPGGAQRLNRAYLRNLFAFACDELPLIFGQGAEASQQHQQA